MNQRYPYDLTLIRGWIIAAEQFYIRPLYLRNNSSRLLNIKNDDQSLTKQDRSWPA